jgi:hypothetical protein
MTADFANGSQIVHRARLANSRFPSGKTEKNQAMDTWSQIANSRFPSGKTEKKQTQAMDTWSQIANSRFPFGKTEKNTNPGYGYVAKREQQIPFRERQKKTQTNLRVR